MTKTIQWICAAQDMSWVPLGKGKSFKLLYVHPENASFVELLRLEPGTEIPLHRHTGEVHAFNLQGSRELHTGEIVEEGSYVHEEAGNVDKWKAVGDKPLVVLVVVNGTVEYLAADEHSVLASYDGKSMRDLWCSQTLEGN